MKITFLVLANSSTGLGHYHRSLTLANYLHSKSHQINFISNKPVEKYKTTIIQKLNDIYLSSWSVPDWMIIDLPFEAENELYELCQQLKIKTLVLNGVGHKVGDKADLRIVQGYDLEARYSGAEYVIIRPELRMIKDRMNKNKNKNKNKNNKINDHRWFVFGGSYDKLGLFNKFIRCFPMKNVVSIDQLVNPDQFSDMLSRCEFSVMHMGMSVWESIYLRIPTYVFSGTEKHLELALRMQAVGLVKAWNKTGLIKDDDKFIEWINKGINKPNPDFIPDGRATERIEKLLMEHK